MVRNMSGSSCRLEFTGHSDDIISVHRVKTVEYCDARGDSVRDDDDELGSYGSDEKPTKIKVSNIGGSRVCFVYAFYDGTWSFSVSMVEEERSIPPWKYTIDQPEHKYSTRLTIEADDDLVYERVEE